MNLSFSQRYGYTEVKDTFQIESMDEGLRNGLWNVFHDSAWRSKNVGLTIDNDRLMRMSRTLWNDLFKIPIDTIPIQLFEVHDKIKKFFFDIPWYLVYDFIEFIAQNFYDISNFTDRCNEILEREMSGYRIVDGFITPIVDEVEIKEVEEAINDNGAQYAKVHLKNALGLLSDRNNPDYRNSIKESISAVEAIAKLIVNDRNTELGSALNKIEKEHGLELHGALKEGFKKIYGYTSDSSGIRHAMTDSSIVSFEDAKFMLVACSAFVNYLVSIAKLTD